MKYKSVLALFSLVFAFLAPGPAEADEVFLKNGDRLTGKVISLEAGTLVFNTSYAGDLPIKWGEVVNLRTESPVRVVLGDTTTALGLVTPGDFGKVRVKTDQIAEPLTVDLANVTTINPKPPMAIKARVNVGVSKTTGNTDTQDIYADAEFVARTDQNRYTIGGLYKSSKDDNVETDNKKLAYMKYDHFFSKKWYAYANATAERDEFKDLDLRYTLGVGTGFQFIESERTNLSFEVGPSYVNENFIVAEDKSFAAGRWGLRFDHYLIPKSLQYFLYHTGLQSLDESDDLVLLTQTGFRIPFYRSLNLTAQMHWEYDKSPSPGKEKSDYAYIITLGYFWAK
jgi:putative salt-induced outer membrane protein YdiY